MMEIFNWITKYGLITIVILLSWIVLLLFRGMWKNISPEQAIFSFSDNIKIIQLGNNYFIKRKIKYFYLLSIFNYFSGFESIRDVNCYTTDLGSATKLTKAKAFELVKKDTELRKAKQNYKEQEIKVIYDSAKDYQELDEVGELTTRMIKAKLANDLELEQELATQLRAKLNI
jgi:hypothetical protein